MASGLNAARGTTSMTGRTRAALILGAGALAIGALALGALASSAPASAKSSSKALTIRTVAVPKIGMVLATSSGLTLYRYAADPAGKVICTRVCAKVWPPFLLPKGVTHVKAAHGVKGLSVVRVPGGRLQVFFHRQALYTFVSDKKKGQASGQGVENDWFAVLSNGKSSALVSAAPSPTPGATTTSPATAKTSGGGSASTPKATTPSATTSPSTTTSTSSSSTKGTTPPVTQPTSPPTTQPSPTTTTTTQPPATTTTSPPGGGVAF